MPIDYTRFQRILLRCTEVASEAGLAPVIAGVYNDVLKGAGERFVAAHRGVTAAESSFAKEHREANEALVTLDKPYRSARAVVKAYLPDLVLPETLKAQPTDTDKLDAIETLLDVIEAHQTEAWAMQLVTGDFGTKGAATVKELNESISANKALADAREARAEGYGPAYERYLRFKRVVREAKGPTSKEYKRIHLRSAAAELPEGGEGAPAPPDNPGGGTA